MTASLYLEGEMDRPWRILHEFSAQFRTNTLRNTLVGILSLYGSTYVKYSKGTSFPCLMYSSLGSPLSSPVTLVQCRLLYMLAMR